MVTYKIRQISRAQAPIAKIPIRATWLLYASKVLYFDQSLPEMALVQFDLSAFFEA